MFAPEHHTCCRVRLTNPIKSDEYTVGFDFDFFDFDFDFSFGVGVDSDSSDCNSCEVSSDSISQTGIRGFCFHVIYHCLVIEFRGQKVCTNSNLGGAPPRPQTLVFVWGGDPLPHTVFFSTSGPPFIGFLIWQPDKMWRCVRGGGRLSHVNGGLGVRWCAPPPEHHRCKLSDPS